MSGWRKFGQGGKPRKPTRNPDPANPYEDTDQEAIARHLDEGFPGHWFHTPNGGKRSKQAAAKLKRQGVKDGVSDIIIVHPFTLYGRPYVGLVDELKRRRGGVLAPSQRWWLAVFARAGFLTSVTEGYQATMDLVELCYGWRPGMGPIVVPVAMTQCVMCGHCPDSVTPGAARFCPTRGECSEDVVELPLHLEATARGILDGLSPTRLGSSRRRDPESESEAARAQLRRLIGGDDV